MIMILHFNWWSSLWLSHTPWNSIFEYLSGFRIALLFLQKTCDKICNRKLSVFSGFRMSLLLKQKTCDKGSMSSGLKVTFAWNKRVQTILIRCMSRFHCYLTWKSWENYNKLRMCWLWRFYLLYLVVFISYFVV
jgi:hypothetical protein